MLPNLLKRFVNDKVVAIVDPPRAGLHIKVRGTLNNYFEDLLLILNFFKVIQALRHLNNLVSLIYVSCNPEMAMSNFIE